MWYYTEGWDALICSVLCCVLCSSLYLSFSISLSSCLFLLLLLLIYILYWVLCVSVCVFSTVNRHWQVYYGRPAVMSLWLFWQPGPTFLKLLRKILGRFLVLEKSLENVSQSTNLELWNNKAIIIVITLLFLHHVRRYYVTLLLNRELISRAKLYLVSAFPDIVKDYPKMRNLPTIFLRSFENVAPVVEHFWIMIIRNFMSWLVVDLFIILCYSDRNTVNCFNKCSQLTWECCWKSDQDCLHRLSHWAPRGLRVNTYLLTC